MPCYHPFIRYETKGGEAKFMKAPDVIPTEWEVKKYVLQQARETVTRADLIPCGKCIGCKLDHSKEWANRMTLEATQWPENWFLTLTYDDTHLPIKQGIDRYTGEIEPKATLYKKDVQDFLKRIRERWARLYGVKPIRTVYAGEYGPSTQRPHYHMALFNLPIYTELKEHKKSGAGYKLWECKEIEECWGKGFVLLGKLEWSSAAYIARYIIKDSASKKTAAGLQEPFIQASTKPGIGEGYLRKHPEILKTDQIYLPGGKIAKIPRYFEKLAERDLKDIKADRKRYAQIAIETKAKKTSKEYLDYLKEEEQIQVDKAKALKRLQN